MDNTNNANIIIPKYKTIFSLRIKRELRKLGFEPDWEEENYLKPGFKCWNYLNTNTFQEALNNLLGGN